MDPAERAFTIREGNKLFREGEIQEAAKLFIATNYQDGLIRMGDFYYYEKNDLASAIKYYRIAKYKKGMDVIIDKIVPVIRKWMKEDTKDSPSVEA